MKKTLLKILVCIIVFIISLFASSKIFNAGNEDMTTNMSDATFPLVHLEEKGIAYNTMHGYREAMDGTLLRENLSVLDEGRRLTFVIDKYGATINNIMFEVRSLDGSRLVEQTKVEDFRESNSTIKATVTIKDLIDPGKEYNWILHLDTNQGTIRYYTRIILADNYALYEKLDYVKTFHEKTFDKEAVKDLVSYMETNKKGDNTTYSKVGIHSNINQLSFGDLDIRQVTESDINICEIEERLSLITNSYQVSTIENNTIYYYNVTEYYRLRYTKDRMYLLDFNRTMSQIFDAEADIYASNKIMLGIRDDNVDMMESEGGNNVAFINEGQLYCYHADNKKIACLFSFYNELDKRCLYNQHGIKILNIDETGNVSFMVYGYMNRGSYEGRVGVSLYEYNGMLNTVEELLFIPYDRPYQTLKEDISQLAYVNKSDIFYIYLDSNILAIDLLSQSYEVIAGNLANGSFQVSSDEEMLVWQNAEDNLDCTKLILMNLNTGNTKEISSTGENRLMPLGFMDKDFIYGIARKNDVIKNSSGAVTFPMYSVRIQDEEGNVLKNYEAKNAYVVGCEITGNMITLSRVEKLGEENNYRSITNDQIVNNVKEEKGYNSFETVVTQNYEKIIQIVLKAAIDVKALKTTMPKFVLYEGSRTLNIEPDKMTQRFYVYGNGGVKGVYSKASLAIQKANEIGGTVTDQNGNYIWKKITRLSKNQIMAISPVSSSEESSTLATCLETILGYAGSSKKVQPLLDKGQTALSILDDSLYDEQILNLNGVEMDAVLYYVNYDIPVLATLNDGNAMLIIGYNAYNIVVLDPKKGTIYKIGMKDATSMFEENGNSFITYVEANK